MEISVKGLIPVCKSDDSILWIIQTTMLKGVKNNRQDESHHHQNHNYKTQIVSASRRLRSKVTTYSDLKGSSGS